MYTNDYKGELFKLKPDWYEVYDENSTESKCDSLVEFSGTDSFWYSVMLDLEKSDKYIYKLITYWFTIN